VKKENFNIKQSSYKKKLKDPRWQKKRLEVLSRDGWCCQNCGDKTTTLHVHHKSYGRKDPWDYPLITLITLCENCHEDESFERLKTEQQLLQVLRDTANISQLQEITHFYEKQVQYFNLLSDEKWLVREKAILSDNVICFVCNNTEDLVVYHKNPSYHLKKPWELPDSDFDCICKSCNLKNHGSYINISEYLDFLIPAFHRAGYYNKDIIDLVSDDYLGKFIRLILVEIKKERLSQIPSQFFDDWIFRKNITYNQLNSLNEEADKIANESKLIILEMKNE